MYVEYRVELGRHMLRRSARNAKWIGSGRVSGRMALVPIPGARDDRRHIVIGHASIRVRRQPIVDR